MEGQPCLRPLVRAADLTGADYWNAATRWMPESTRALTISKWDSILDPGPRWRRTSGDVRQHIRGRRDRCSGEKVEVCFDVGFTESRSSPVSPESH